MLSDEELQLGGRLDNMDTSVVSCCPTHAGDMTSANPSVLVVDDDPLMILFIEEYLGEAFSLSMATSGSEALAILEEGVRPKLIILDLFMPGMDGFAFLGKVRAEPEYNAVAILVLSGSESSEDRVNALEHGADDFVVKPFNPRELSARVRNLIRRVGG